MRSNASSFRERRCHVVVKGGMFEQPSVGSKMLPELEKMGKVYISMVVAVSCDAFKHSAFESIEVGP